MVLNPVSQTNNPPSPKKRNHSNNPFCKKWTSVSKKKNKNGKKNTMRISFSRHLQYPLSILHFRLRRRDMLPRPRQEGTSLLLHSLKRGVGHLVEMLPMENYLPCDDRQGTSPVIH